MKSSRTDNSIKNTLVSSIAHIVTVVLSFAVRTVFIHRLGNSYLGINGLFSNILSLLSFAELGLGNAIVFALYKPIADDDYKKTAALMNFYAKAYRAIGFFILAAGIVIVPFLGYIIGDTSQIPKDLPPIEFIFLLYILNTSLGYFFNYKRSIIVASQNGKIDSINQLTFNIIKDVFQILALVLFKSFILYLLVQIVCTFLGNLTISNKADRLFPYLEENRGEVLDAKTYRGIQKNVLAMLCHKLGSVVVSGTDNILITQFVGILATGVYSNYVLLTSTVTMLIQQVMSPITASVGNLVALEDKDKGFFLFKKLMMANSFIAILFSTCLLTLSNRFVLFMWGENSVMSLKVVIVLMLNFYINTMRKSSQIFIDTTGLFWQIRWKSLFEAGINLFFSIALASWINLGILGIVLGTLISNLLTNFWWEPYVVFKYYFKKQFIVFVREYTIYFMVFVVTVAFSVVIECFIQESFVGLLCCGTISVVVSLLVFTLVFHKREEYAYYVSLLKTQLMNRLKQRG